ncbi:MAG: arginase family protein [Candidatus Pacearchaeota archaeon]|jgi:arginase family enzyme
MQIIRVRLINSVDKTFGCEEAPVEVLKELKKIELNEKAKEINFNNLNLEEIHVDLNNLEEANYLIFENSIEIFEKNHKALFIGGDHSISFSILRAFNRTQENPLLIVFDAHADCCEETNFANDRNWLRKLIESGFDGKKVILISTRKLLAEEIDFIKQQEMTLISMDVLQEDLNGVCDLIMERARGSDGFYISTDLNCVDPAYAPGASCLESGGMSSRDLIYFIKRLVLLNNFRGADVVEINPSKDINKMTIKLGAKLLSEMI